jgi:anti-sigma regulatory factor (Ser/Thr protein kinase)
VAKAIAFTRRFAKTNGLSADAADRLAVVVEEWAANIVEHSGAAPTSLIMIRLQRLADGVRIGFSDAGVAFDPRAAIHEGPDPERGGGAGIAMIRSWCEIEAYARRRGRNRLVLRSRS